MKQGFPRPRVFVKKLTGFYITSRMNEKDREEWENKSYPHPFSARDDSLADIHDGRVKICTTMKKCIVCGDPVEGKKVWIYRNEMGLNNDSGPFHEKCMKLTQTLCPAVASARWKFEWYYEVWEDVAPLIRGRA